jgi:hypothetical protein
MQYAKETGFEYDSDLQMFRLPSREPSLASLRFLRWLADRGDLQHAVSGPPTGGYPASVRGTEAEPVENSFNKTASASAGDLFTEAAHDPASPTADAG